MKRIIPLISILLTTLFLTFSCKIFSGYSLVYFYSDTDGTVFTMYAVEYGDQVKVPPEEPKKTGYDFAGWYADKDLDTPFDFDTQIKEDTSIYAKWEIQA